MELAQVVKEIAAWNRDGLKNQDGEVEISNSRPDSVEVKSGNWDWMERKIKLGEQKTHGKIFGLFDEFFREIALHGKSNLIYQICCRQFIVHGKIQLLCAKICRQPALHGKSTLIYQICCRQFTIHGKIPHLFNEFCRQTF